MAKPFKSRVQLVQKNKCTFPIRLHLIHTVLRSYIVHSVQVSVVFLHYLVVYLIFLSSIRYTCSSVLPIAIYMSYEHFVSSIVRHTYSVRRASVDFTIQCCPLGRIK